MEEYVLIEGTTDGYMFDEKSKKHLLFENKEGAFNYFEELDVPMYQYKTLLRRKNGKEVLFRYKVFKINS